MVVVGVRKNKFNNFNLIRKLKLGEIRKKKIKIIY